MGKEPKKVRFIKPWHFYAVGDIAHPPKPMREILLDRGLIEVVEDEKPVKKKASKLFKKK